MSRSTAITTTRLRLLPMSAAFLRAALTGDEDLAEAALGTRLSPGWRDERHVFELRLGQLELDPALEPWLTRAIELSGAQRMVGITGFHGPPGFGDTLESAPSAVELGYTVFEPFRRRGIATEASRGLMRWAAEAHGVDDFVLSIAPTNTASQRTAARLGFERVGEHAHDERGLELVYRRTEPIGG